MVRTGIASSQFFSESENLKIRDGEAIYIGIFASPPEVEEGAL